MGLERGPLSLVSTTVELVGRSSGSGLESRVYGCRESLTLTAWHLLTAKVGTNFAGKAVAARSIWSVRGLRPRNLISLL
jgi:hypothetical protein